MFMHLSLLVPSEPGSNGTGGAAGSEGLRAAAISCRCPCGLGRVRLTWMVSPVTEGVG